MPAQGQVPGKYRLPETWLQETRAWAADRGVQISSDSYAIFENRIRTVVVPNYLKDPAGLTADQRHPRDPTAALHVLLETMRRTSPDGHFHEYSLDAALAAGLCPGFWPFC